MQVKTSSENWFC